MGEFLNEIKAQQVDTTTLGKLKLKLNDEEYTDLLKALADTSISIPAIVRALSKRNLKVAATSLGLVRRELHASK